MNTVSSGPSSFAYPPDAIIMTRLARALPPLQSKPEDQVLSVAMKQQALFQLFKEVELEYHAYFWAAIIRKNKQLRLRGGTSSLDAARGRLKICEKSFEARLTREFLRLQRLTLAAVSDVQAPTYIRLKKECEYLQRGLEDCSTSRTSSGRCTPVQQTRSASATPLKAPAKARFRDSVAL